MSVRSVLVRKKVLETEWPRFASEAVVALLKTRLVQSSAEAQSLALTATAVADELCAALASRLEES